MASAFRKQWERSRGQLSLENSFDARRIAITYLPEALNAYLSIPASYARTRLLSNGKTALDTFDETIVELESKVRELADDLASHDAQAFLAHSDAFRSKLDSAFALGREEISTASAMMQNRFMQSNFVGMEDSPVYKAIAEMRGLLDELNPGKQGDLLQQNKLLGFIPYGNKLQAYFRKYQSASSQLQSAMSQVHAARDDMQKDVAAIDTTRVQVWEALQKLAAAACFATTLDTRLKDRVDALQATDAPKAQTRSR